jgi:hypothetical protein
VARLNSTERLLQVLEGGRITAATHKGSLHFLRMPRRNIVLQIANFWVEAEILFLIRVLFAGRVLQLGEWFHAVSEFSRA